MTSSPYEAIEFKHVSDVLDCTPDSTQPVLLSLEARNGSDADLVAFNRSTVNKVLDQIGRIEDVSQDALRSYYVDLYQQVVAARGLAGFHAIHTEQTTTYIVQGLKLLPAPDHLGALLGQLTGEDAADEETFGAKFAAAEQVDPLVATNAAFLRTLDNVHTISASNVDVALHIELGPDIIGDGLDLIRWTGDVDAYIAAVAAAQDS